MPLTLGTAGHIDHGKTALVRALTGVETDRLPEERRRGISIELGFAPLVLPSGRRVSVVDVPGHERLVRTMVAGATGVDLWLMTVAADDGVMPQTREHASVLDALGLSVGVVAVTKADLADPARAAAEAAELLPGARVVAVSARTGTGLAELGAALDAVAGGAPARPADGAVRLHVDRAFTIHGAGTVVTGTLWSGTVGRGDDVRLLPAGRRARVRGVQVHDERVERAQAGQRVALNLAGVGREEVRRGDLVTTDAGIAPTYRIEARVPADLPARVMVHHGTREAPARAVARGDGIWQLRLEAPLLACRGDRVVVRSIAPPDTLGGGPVTAIDPPRDRKAPAPKVLRERTGSDPFLSRGGVGAPPPVDAGAAAGLAAAGLTPPADADLGVEAAVLAGLRQAGVAVRIGRTQHIHADALARARDVLVELLARDGEVTLAGYRDALGTSRRVAQALLEHFDSERLTLRRGDVRVARSAGR